LQAVSPEMACSQPPGQVEHCDAPSRDANVPGLHGRQDAESFLGWWKPSGHNVHVAAFWSAEKRPATHTTHDWSVSFRRFPALHAEQEALPLPALRPSWQV